MIGWLIYFSAGLLIAAAASLIDGQRGLMAAAVAWLICGVPILTGRVAKRMGVRKKTANRGLIAFPPGLLPRWAWTLGIAAVVFISFEERLGTGFWIALLACYLIALVIRTRDLLDDLGDRTETGPT